jgi:acid phosphatase (class A)
MSIDILRNLSIAAALGAATLAQAQPRPALADPSMAAPVHTDLAGYLSADALDMKTLLGPPPAPKSPQGRADRAAFEATRSLKDSPRWKLAQQQNDLWNGAALKSYACALGHEVSDKATPRTMILLHRMELDVRTVGSPAKDFYNRTRPAIGNHKPICIPREPWLATNGSYPSGHSATGWAWALVLAEAEPANATAVLAVGRQMGDSRIVCGVHYPSDIEAGRTVAASMVARLHAEPAFADDLAAAKQELAAAPSAQGCGS